MICVDTDIVIDHANSSDKASTSLMSLAGEHDKIYLTSITTYEFLKGDPQGETEKWDAHLSVFEVLPFDEDAARIAAELDEDLNSKGDHPGMEDLLIGAIAKSRDLPVATKNTKDFQRIEGLRVEEV